MRGGTVLMGGIAAIVVGLLIGAGIQQSAMDAIRRGGPGEIMDKMQGLQAASAFANLLFFGGCLTFVIGIVLIVVKSQQKTQDSHSPSDRSTLTNTNRSRENELEEENRRLREELASKKLNERDDTA